MPALKYRRTTIQAYVWFEYIKNGTLARLCLPICWRPSPNTQTLNEFDGVLFRVKPWQNKGMTPYAIVIPELRRRSSLSKRHKEAIEWLVREYIDSIGGKLVKIWFE